MIIKIDDEIGSWGLSSKEFKAQIQNGKEDIILELNTAGGSVYDGLEIHNTIKNYTKGKVTARLGALCASIGTVIALACDEIEAHENTTFMIHNALTSCYGNHNDLRKDADILEGLSNIIANVYVNKTNKSIKDIKKLMNDESYFFGNEILQNNFIDRIISKEDDKKEYDKDNLIAYSKTKIQNCIKNTKQNNEVTNDKLVAILKKGDFESEVFNDAKIKKGDNMSQEKVEIVNTDKIVKDEVGKAIAVDRERIAKIQVLECENSLKIEAIKNGVSAESLAYNLVIENQKKEAIKVEAIKRDYVESQNQDVKIENVVNESSKQDKEDQEILNYINQKEK
jgi:ATP-dependent protease ClpP protease subunit